MRHSNLIKSMGVAAFSAALMGQAQAGPTTYLGEVVLTAASYCPEGTVEATGQLLAVNNFQALFSLYGTTFGGDGRSTFGVPDLRGRAPVHFGTGPGLTYYQMGSRAGVETNTLTTANIPAHNHSVRATSQAPNTDDPDGAHLASAASPMRAALGGTTNPSYNLASTQIGPSGTQNPTPINNVQPILAMRYCVNISGAYPPRN